MDYFKPKSKPAPKAPKVTFPAKVSKRNKTTKAKGKGILDSLKKTCILKAKSNFTFFSSEYIYSHSDFKQIKYCNEFPTHALT